jgi:hypothetical protein
MTAFNFGLHANTLAQNSRIRRKNYMNMQYMKITLQCRRLIIKTRCSEPALDGIQQMPRTTPCAKINGSLILRMFADILAKTHSKLGSPQKESLWFAPRATTPASVYPGRVLRTSLFF